MTRFIERLKQIERRQRQEEEAPRVTVIEVYEVKGDERRLLDVFDLTRPRKAGTA